MKIFICEKKGTQPGVSNEDYAKGQGVFFYEREACMIILRILKLTIYESNNRPNEKFNN